MSDAFTILNPGVGGDVMDESNVIYGTEPLIRKRPRVVITGENAGEIVPAITSTPSGSEYGVVTRPVLGYPGSPVTVFNITTLVPTNTETTITTYTVPMDSTFYFIGFVASGNANALFKLYVDSNPVLAGRSSVANLTLPLTYSLSPFQISEGITIVLKVMHQAGTSCDFEGTILGYLI
jgi:hypothetical protein